MYALEPEEKDSTKLHNDGNLKFVNTQKINPIEDELLFYFPKNWTSLWSPHFRLFFFERFYEMFKVGCTMHPWRHRIMFHSPSILRLSFDVKKLKFALSLFVSLMHCRWIFIRCTRSSFFWAHVDAQSADTGVVKQTRSLCEGVVKMRFHFS